MDGIRKKIDPGDPIEKNVYKLTDAERKKLGIGLLPTSLEEALEEFNADTVCKRALGEAVEKYLELKWKEWEDYEKNNPPDNPQSITSWELMRYLYA
jgi:glutamine synthetase